MKDLLSKKEKVNEKFEQLFQLRDQLMKQRSNETDGTVKDNLTRQIQKISVKICYYRREYPNLLNRNFRKETVEPKPMKLNPHPMKLSLQAIEAKAKQLIDDAMKKNNDEEVKRIQERLENVRLKFKYEYCSM